jgi:hypothetical protein
MSAQRSADLATMAAIESLAAKYSERRARIYERIMELELEIERLKRSALPAIKADVGHAIAARDELRTAIEGSAELFVRPRTRVFSGIRVGFGTTGSKVEFDDEAEVIKRIRERLPANQAELLIRRRESVHKPAVYDLEDADLRRLGIRVTGGDDTVVIKPQDGDVAKLVDALLGDAGDAELEL